MSISNKTMLKEYILLDAKRNNIGGKFSYWAKLLYGNVNAHAYRYMKSLRKYEYYSNLNSPLRFLYRYYNRRLGLRYNISMPINKIGPGVYLPHLEGGVIINCKSIGYNLCINAGALIGSKKADETPIIGNNVTLCPGCKVIGAITIGDNVLVAPNAVVVKDVPSNCIVAGVPAKIIRSIDS